MDAAASHLTELERVPRRVRSTGDLERPYRSRRHPSAHQRRSEGQASISWARDSRGRDLHLAVLDESDAFPENILFPEEVHRAAARTPTARELWEIGTVPLPDGPPNNDDAGRRNARPPPRGWLGKVMVFFGQAGPNARVRSQLISLVWTLGAGIVQFIVIVTLLAYAAHRQSPTMPGTSEWDACQRPLGVWNSIWIVREGLVCLCAYWSWRREREVRLTQERNRSQDAEAPYTEPTVLPDRGWDYDMNRPRATRRSTYSTSRRRPTTQDLLTQLPHTHLYNRLTMLSSALTFVWFLTAHILEFTSVNTCRHSAPHLWWLTFGILCTLYFMILEIFLLGLLVFILGPVVFLLYSIILLCLGRHPIQNPHQIRPDVGKLPKSVVDQIPLVLYIPPPPEEDSKDSKNSPITIPPSVFSYPPKKSPTSAIRKRRFAFLRRSTKSKSNDSDKGGGTEKGKGKKNAGKNEIKTWEDHWVSGDYPFVRLEGNRAACAVCLMDFSEPERVDKEEKKPAEEHQNESQKAASPTAAASPVVEQKVEEVQEVQVDEITQADADRLKLEDAGEGAQPLRLLPCGHVFHKTCIDPWLTDVSGRCPVCQRRVELPEPDKKEKKQRRENRRTQSSPTSP